MSLAFFSCIVLCVQVAYASPNDNIALHGIVNRSYAVIAIDTCRDAVRLLDDIQLASGQRVVLYQAFGYHRQPVWTSVDTSEGGWIYLTSSLPSTLDGTLAVQLITVQRAISARTSDTIRCIAFDGLRGGVIAIECTDTLYVNNVIEASRCGFRGGLPGAARADKAGGDSVMHWTLGQNGEGIERLAARKRTDKTVLTQGGGRGGARNGGGGGGGNVADGGAGGWQCSAFTGAYVGGASGRHLIL
ncbi:MAG: hypothetical protein SGJ05_03850, partial [bacterium]|nr:hypothetical protein [bacterium]